MNFERNIDVKETLKLGYDHQSVEALSANEFNSNVKKWYFISMLDLKSILIQFEKDQIVLINRETHYIDDTCIAIHVKGFNGVSYKSTLYDLKKVFKYIKIGGEYIAI
jgi:hypothetical protein